MALAGECQAAVDGDANLVDLVQEAGLEEVRHEDVASPHWADGMRRRRADADGEEVKGRDDGMFVVCLAVGPRLAIPTRSLVPG